MSKEKAIELRKQGLTYQQIADKIDVSVDWCKRSLKGVKRDKDLITEACLDELILKATKPEGITVYEANAIIFRHHKDTQLTKDQVKDLRRKASNKNKDCLFRPPWVDATAPTESYKSMLAYTTHLLDEVDNVVRWYCESYPSVNEHSVRYEILKHLYPKISPEPLTGRMMRNEVVVETLEGRNITEVGVEEERSEETSDYIITQTDLHLTDKDLLEEYKMTEEQLDKIWKV